MAKEKQSVMWLWVHHRLRRKQQAIFTRAAMPDCLRCYEVYSLATRKFTLTNSTPAVSAQKEIIHFLIVYLQVEVTLGSAEHSK